jgi:hypothetical protein
MTGLKRGAIAFLDVLGFKGIWNRIPPGVVLKKMRQIKTEGKRIQTGDHNYWIVSDDGFKYSVKCISDTVVVVVTPRGRDSTDRMMYKALVSATWIGISIIEEALEGGELPLLLRGCVGAGLMKMDGDFLIGPAVDETASFYEKAEGPFFWMTPSALALDDEFAETFMDRIEPALMTRYAVPLKDGKRIETLVHAYSGATCPIETWTQTRLRIEKAFGKKPLRPDVAIKYANTISFLDSIERDRCQTKPMTIALRRPYWEDLTLNQKLSVLKEGGSEEAANFPRRQSCRSGFRPISRPASG